MQLLAESATAITDRPRLSFVQRMAAAEEVIVAVAREVPVAVLARMEATREALQSPEKATPAARATEASAVAVAVLEPQEETPESMVATEATGRPITTTESLRLTPAAEVQDRAQTEPAALAAEVLAVELERLEPPTLAAVAAEARMAIAELEVRA